MQLEPTSERLVEDQYMGSESDYLIYLFHIKTYDFALPFVRGAEVLDLGCGSGYGTARLAPHCSRIVGVDVADDAVRYAKENYSVANASFEVIRPAEDEPLPFADASFDAVLSFQVIEHVGDVEAYLSEINRVLKPGGVFVCATPDRETRLFSFQKPWNRWHVQEFSAEQLESSLQRHFPSVQVLKMSGSPEVIRIETDRTKRMRLALLPATLPFIPERLRSWMLGSIKQLAKPKLKNRAHEFPFSDKDIFIKENASPSVNLVSVARKGDFY